MWVSGEACLVSFTPSTALALGSEGGPAPAFFAIGWLGWGGGHLWAQALGEELGSYAQ